MRNLVRKQTSDSYQTFADLVFCKLIALLLFVLVLALEVNQRVRADDATDVNIEEMVEAETLDEAKQQIEELTEVVEKLKKAFEVSQQKYDELAEAHRQLQIEHSELEIAFTKIERERDALAAEVERLKPYDGNLGRSNAYVVANWMNSSVTQRKRYLHELSAGVKFKYLYNQRRYYSDVHQLAVQLNDSNPDFPLDVICYLYLVSNIRL